MLQRSRTMSTARPRVEHLREFLERMPLFPGRLEENPPRDSFFEHAEYLKVRARMWHDCRRTAARNLIRAGVRNASRCCSLTTRRARCLITTTS